MFPAFATADMPLDYLHNKGRYPNVQRSQFNTGLPKDDIYPLNSDYFHLVRDNMEFIVEDFIRNCIKDLEKSLDSLYDKIERENHSLADVNNNLLYNTAAHNFIGLYMMNPSLVVSTPTLDDSLFFTAHYEKCKIYIESHFDKENNSVDNVCNVYNYEKEIIASFSGDTPYIYSRAISYVV